MICKRCESVGAIQMVMVKGYAIDPKYDERCRYIVGRFPLRHDEVELIDVWKCPECGHTEYIDPPW